MMESLLVKSHMVDDRGVGGLMVGPQTGGYPVGVEGPVVGDRVAVGGLAVEVLMAVEGGLAASKDLLEMEDYNLVSLAAVRQVLNQAVANFRLGRRSSLH